MGTICISSGSGRRSIYKMAGGYLSERSGSFDYNTGSISVSVSGKPWGCIWNPAESADCICSWSIVDFFAVVFIYRRIPQKRRFVPLRVCAILLASGAIGNLIDRLARNYVVDFCYFNLIDFPIFNVADCYVVIGCILFGILILFYYKDQEFDWVLQKKGSRS